MITLIQQCRPCYFKPANPTAFFFLTPMDESYFIFFHSVYWPDVCFYFSFYLDCVPASSSRSCFDVIVRGQANRESSRTTDETRKKRSKT